MADNKKLTRKEKFSNVSTKPEKQHAANNHSKWSNYYVWIVAVLAMVVYFNTISFDYALDDYASIIENRSTQKGDFKEIFKTSYRYGSYLASDELYRPLPKSLFAIQWKLAPKNPHLGHWMNVVLYGLLGIVVFNFCKRLFSGHLLNSFLASILFVVLPIHTEVVANIKSVDEILAMLFGLMMLNSFIDYLSNSKLKSLIISVLCFVAALLSKESSITIVAVLPLLVFYFDGSNFKSKVIVLFSFFVIGGLYLLARSNVYGIVPLGTLPSSSDNLLVKAVGSLERYTTAIYILGIYLFRTLIPIGLTFDASFPELTVVGAGNFGFLISLIVLVTLFALAIYGIIKKEIYGIALLFFFITISVSSNIFTLIGTQYGERLMFMPSLGIGIAVIALISKVKFDNYAMIILPLVLVYSFTSINRNKVWENNETLYRSGLISAPNSARTNYYMGNFLVKEDNLKGKSQQEQAVILKEGISCLKKSIELTPYFSDAWNQMGLAYMRMKEYNLSRTSFLNAIKYNPNDPVINNNYGNLLFNVQQPDSALLYFEKAVNIKADYTDALNNIGSVYGNKGQFQKALTYFEKAYAVDPSNIMANRFLGMTWQNLGNAMLAKQFTDQADALSATKK